MYHFFITGVSRGLGKALAEQALAKGHVVHGIGRSTSISHACFKFYTCDFENAAEIEALTLEWPTKEKVIWINNAGVIGEIKRLADVSASKIVELMQVNAIAPMLLTQKAIQLHSSNVEQQLIICNISSGAGRRAIPSWASYCASKASIDLFSEVVQQEEQEKQSGVKLISLAPGVIDTDMQTQIRSSATTDFSSLQQFQELAETQQLQSAKETAERIIERLLANDFTEVVTRL